MRFPTHSLSAAMLLAGCVAAPAPVPPPAVVARPQPLPRPVAPPPGADWRDWPYSAGTWTYARAGAGSVARFGVAGGTARMTIGCVAATRRVTLSLADGGATTATIRTGTATRRLPLRATADGSRSVALAPADSLLDAMGFSRGRFVVERAGSPPLVMPPWAEIGRVTEDCRG